MTHKMKGVHIQEYAYYVNKLRQNVGLEIWICRQIVTSQTAPTKNKWPLLATERNPPWKFSAYATAYIKAKKYWKGFKKDWKLKIKSL